jgi:ABC-2 type transport system ATP-binding protein
MQAIITVEQLVHRYGTKLALNGMSFEVGKGEVFGLLGPNGAGKTTTIRLLNGLLQAHSGKMNVLGFNPSSQGVEIRRHSGVLTETPALYERLTALENLRFFGSLADLTPRKIEARSHELLEFFDLHQCATDRVGTYSKGMKQRLALARALLTSPELLFLDEPTSGLDPEVAKQVHDLIQDVRLKDGNTVMLCTHHLYEAERLCNRMAVMGRGRAIAVGTLTELRNIAAPQLRIQFQFASPLSDEVMARLRQCGGVEKCDRTAASGCLVQVQNNDVTPALVNWLVGQKEQILAVEPQLASLEEIYFILQQQAEEGIQ